VTIARPSLLAFFIAAYWDAGRAMRAHWRLALLTALLVFVAFLARAHLPRMAGGPVIGQLLLRHGIDAVAIVLAAPFLLAVHRFILLDEIRDRYAFEPNSARFQSFGGWLVVAMLVAGIPSLLYFAAQSSAPIYYSGVVPAVGMTRLLLLAAASLIVLVGFLRMILLFPAVAVDAPEASWQSAFAETQGASWFAGFACVLPLIPVFLVGVAVVPIAGGIPFARHAVLAVLLLSAFTLLAVVASRLYQILARRAASLSHE